MSDEIVKIKIDKTQAILLKRKMNHNGKAQIFFANEIKKKSDPYVPFDTGTLKNDARIVQSKTLNNTQIIYYSVYGRYHWHGKVMVGKAPKKVTSRNMKYSIDTRRGPYWADRMWADRGTEIVRNVANYTGGRAR
ncbi:MAG: minor capsid protein [Eubacterium sp.]